MSSRAPVAIAAAEPRRKPSLKQRFQYGFDNTMSRGTPALVAWLALATVVLVALFSAIVLIGGLAPKDDTGHRSGIIGQTFKTLLHALDPGTVAGDTGKWPFLAAMFGITLGGLFVVSALIGVIATGLDNKIEDLRKGRSFVIEHDHTLILGWSETVFTILSELKISNENEDDPVIVILADKDRVEMEDAVRQKVGHMGNTRVVCRTGDAIDLDHLRVANPQEARSIIVLSPEDEDPDSQVIKTVLALTRGPIRRADTPYRIVAEIEERQNLEAARLVGGEEAVIVDKSETISRLIVQTARQSGLSIAYLELLDFEGDEIYFREDERLVGTTFGDAQHAYEDCCVMGLMGPDGTVRLNPPGDTPIEAGTSVIAIAEDDAQLLGAEVTTGGSIDEAAIVQGVADGPGPRRALVLGWNRRARSVISEFDKYLEPGSTMTVVSTYAHVREEVEAEASELKNLEVQFFRGDTTDRRTLEALQVEQYDHVMVLCYSDDLDAQRADARTLVTLLHLREIASQKDTHYTIVSEMLDERDRQLAEVTQVDDVIVSDKVISLLLTQISENPHLAEVFADLFDADGSELYMRPVEQYLAVGHATTFRTLVESARRRGEVAIGYRDAAFTHDASAQYGMRVNPSKSLELTPSPGDRVVVLAES